MYILSKETRSNICYLNVFSKNREPPKQVIQSLSVRFLGMPSMQSWFCAIVVLCQGGIRGNRDNAAIAVEGEQNAVDHCGNDGNFLPYSAIFILFTLHYYFET
jgi:hypothetical protein